MAVVNMPGGEILPAAERGTIDCAEWVGGIEDLRLGLHTVWKYHYTPGMHESASVAEIAINKDVWDRLPAQNKEAIKSATSETFLRWWATLTGDDGRTYYVSANSKEPFCNARPDHTMGHPTWF
jgi:TRAP-type mannitol/chloroaromatic compound transport system substrate-binding protein